MAANGVIFGGNVSAEKALLGQSKLFGEFDKLADFEEVSATDIASLKGLVLDVVEVIGPHLDRIRVTFTQYTEHDFRHLLNVADHIYRFLPNRNIDNDKRVIALNGLELTYLWMSILLHDVGMFVSSADEKQKLLDSPEYKAFQRYTLDR